MGRLGWIKEYKDVQLSNWVDLGIKEYKDVQLSNWVDLEIKEYKDVQLSKLGRLGWIKV